ncbi:fibrous sheath-interacting protein 1 [Corythoichthys intestinalis]|uniref:fibrous sheath-interacting protein 1 n=1 Tax=Corythoichthys intestinalis TaxID=161448 RepID=UPI0025A578C6|nr:fibrous sheath-interacting protein 1 [Corythoichthys intestinalis]
MRKQILPCVQAWRLESSSTSRQYDINATDEEKQDPKLQRAIEEMRKLDELLSVCMTREKEAKRQRKQLQAELWQELMDSLPEGRSENSQEAINARLFMALEEPIDHSEKEDFETLFQSQTCESELDKRLKTLLESDERADELSEVSESMCEEPDEGNHGDTCKGKKKQKNFVKRNIELARGKGGQVLLTQAEEERLAELLRDMDEEEEDSARRADNEENMWAVPVSTSQGYTQDTSDMERLNAIDSKLLLFKPVVDLPTLRSSCAATDEERTSDIGPRHDVDPQPGEKVLQDIKERRTQELQLLEIQRQLDLLGQNQEMTSESESLSQEQLLCLLDGFELTESEPEP